MADVATDDKVDLRECFSDRRSGSRSHHDNRVGTIDPAIWRCLFHAYSPGITDSASAGAPPHDRGSGAGAGSPKAVQGAGFGDIAALLVEGIVAGGISAGQLVGIAHTSALSARHADIGVGTLESWRGRGIATASAAIVAAEVQHLGKIPVWSTGEDNHPSRRVAERLGFTEIGRRVYLIPE